MPTPSGRESLMDAILAGQQPSNFLVVKPCTDWIGDGTISPVDGQVYRSKDDYLGHLKRNGMHIAEDSPQRSQEKRAKKTEKQKEEYQKALKDQKEFMEGRII